MSSSRALRAWLVNTHPVAPRGLELDRHAILLTHAYLYSDETRYDWPVRQREQNWNPNGYGVAKLAPVNDGEALWQKLVSRVDLNQNEPTIILGTGSTEDNLRTALWIKRKYANALVFARTNDQSALAVEVGAEHDINCFSIKQLMEDNLPADWLR